MTGLEKGKALFEKQEYYPAIEALEEFLLDNINNADALYVRAICYRKIEKYEKSVEDLTAILIRLPNEATLLCDRAISHFRNKNIEAAMDDMDRVVELDPENPYRYSSRAYIRANIDVPGAMKDYEKAIELDPEDEISLNNLGLLQENVGNFKASKKSFKKSNELIGYDPEKRKVKVQNNENQKPLSLTTIMLSVFNSKSARQEYFQFIKSMFKK